MERIPEGTTNYITLEFFDKDGAPVVPSTVTWEAWDKKSKTQISAPASLTPAAVIELTIPTTVNAMVDEDNETEIRQIVIKTTYSGSQGANKTIEYLVENVPGA